MRHRSLFRLGSSDEVSQRSPWPRTVAAWLLVGTTPKVFAGRLSGLPARPRNRMDSPDTRSRLTAARLGRTAGPRTRSWAATRWAFLSSPAVTHGSRWTETATPSFTRTWL